MGYKDLITSLHMASSLQGCWVCCDTEETVPSAGDTHRAPLLSQPEHPELHLSCSIQALGWAALPTLPLPSLSAGSGCLEADLCENPGEATEKPGRKMGCPWYGPEN